MAEEKTINNTSDLIEDNGNKGVKTGNYTYKIEHPKKFSVKISIKVESKYFTEKKEEVYNKLKKGVSIKGFRPGMAPKNLIEAHLGPKLFEETVNNILPQVAFEILQQERINPISQLHYHLEKVSEADGLQYHVEFESLPEIKLPDFSKIKVAKEGSKVTDKEIDAVIEDMLNRDEQKGSEKKAEKVVEAKPEKKLANDKWAAELGIDNVKTVKELKEEIRRQIEKQKKMTSEEKYKADLLDAAVEKAGIEVPESFIERELQSREVDYKKRIESIGLKFDEFLKTRKTTLEDLKKEWKNDAERRISREILLVEVAKKQEIKIAKEDIEKELSQITDPQIKSQYDNEKGRNYIATVLIQQKAISWIVNQIGQKK